MEKIVSATEARKQFFKLIEYAGKPGASVTITLQGHPPVVIMSQEEWEGWIETLEIMSDPELVKDIRESLQEDAFVTLEELEESMWSHHSHVHRHSQKASRKAISKAATKRTAARARRSAKPSR